MNAAAAMGAEVRPFPSLLAKESSVARPPPQKSFAAVES